MSGLKVLVTGGSGVVGHYVVESLLGRGVEVASFDVARPARPHTGCTYRQGDIQGFPSLFEALAEEKPGVVIHLAAMLGEVMNKQPSLGQKNNIGGTLNLLEGARLAGVRRVLMASTRTVYPNFAGTPYGHPRYEPVPEDHPLFPTRPYEVTKYVGERMGETYAKQYGFEFAAFRFAMYYSAERALNPGTRALGTLNSMVKNAVAAQPTFVPKGGDQRFDLIYVRDLADLLCRAAVMDKPLGYSVYNVGSGQATSLFEFARAVKAACPSASIEVGPGTEFAPGHYCVLNIARAANDLGFVPRFPLDAGLRDCMEKLRALVGAADATSA